MATKTPATNKEIVYTDFTNNFTKHPVKRDLVRSVNEDAVKKALINIIQTDYYERPMRPLFGANLRKFLFDQITSLTLTAIKSAVETAISNYEPRVDVIDIVVSSTQPNQVDITVTFALINRLDQITLNTTVALDRVR